MIRLFAWTDHWSLVTFATCVETLIFMLFNKCQWFINKIMIWIPEWRTWFCMQWWIKISSLHRTDHYGLYTFITNVRTSIFRLSNRWCWSSWTTNTHQWHLRIQTLTFIWIMICLFLWTDHWSFVTFAISIETAIFSSFNTCHWCIDKINMSTLQWKMQSCTL